MGASGPTFPAPAKGNHGLAGAPGANVQKAASVLKDCYQQSGQAETDAEQERPPPSKRPCRVNGRGNDSTASDSLSQPDQPSGLAIQHASSLPTAVRNQEPISEPTIAPSNPDEGGQPSDMGSRAAGAGKPANAGADIAEPRDPSSHAQQSGALLHRGPSQQDVRVQSAAAAASAVPEGRAVSGLAEADCLR